MARDLTPAAYEKKVRSYGFGPKRFWGYRELPAPYGSLHVSEYRRDDFTGPTGYDDAIREHRKVYNGIEDLIEKIATECAELDTMTRKENR